MPEIIIDGWQGRVEYPVEIAGETPKRYKVKWILDAPFTPPRSGTVRFKGDVFLVPKHAVRVGTLTKGFKMYYFIRDMGIVKLEWDWNEIERRAWRYAQEESEEDHG